MDQSVVSANAAMEIAQSGHSRSQLTGAFGHMGVIASDYGHTLLALKHAINALHYIACECQDGRWADQAQTAIDEISERVMNLLGGSHDVLPS